MDPNEALENFRAGIAALGKLSDDDSSELLDILFNIAEDAQALDNWLTHGGFLPEAWQP